MDVYGHICILDVNGIFKKIKDAFLASVFYHQMILHQASGSQQPGDATGGLAV